jgi:hypothetical protein
MNRIVVGVFDDRRAMEGARQDLLAAGIHDTQISIEEDAARTADARVDDVAAQVQRRYAPLAQESGIVETIARMFSGLLLEDHTIGREAAAVRPCHALVAVHGLDEATAERAAMILGRHGKVATHADAQRSPPGRDAGAAHEAPRVYPLPNSPTGWDQATRHDSLTWLRR